jgi:predicted ATP-grasp superfamily ATP-dependent carboligase
MGDVVHIKDFRSKKRDEQVEENPSLDDRAEAIKESLKKISELMRELRESQKGSK